VIGPRQKVAIVIPSLAGGGAERVMLQVAGGLDSSRFDVTLIALNGKGDLSGALPSSLHFVDLGTARLRHAIGLLTDTLRGLGPDVVVSTMGYLNLAILAFVRPRLSPACRYVVREANMPEATISQFPLRLMGRLGYRLFYPKADRVVCNAQTVAAALRNLGVPAGIIAQIDNPIDVDFLRGTAEDIHRSESGRHFIAVGRLTRQKGFDRLIDWFQELPADCRLTILGDGPDRADLEHRRHTNGLDDRVSMPGFCLAPWREVAQADAFLMPSRWEGMPNAALEALALGVPVIAMRDAGGLGELSNAVPAGHLTIAKDGPAFIQAMQDTVKLAGGLRPAALPDRFRKDKVLDAYAEIIAG